MKQVYLATYGAGGGTAKVFGSSAEDAKKAAFAAYTFTGAMWSPNPDVDDIVKKVELDPDQTAGGAVCQPCVQDESFVPVASKDAIDRILNGEKENN